MNRDVQLVIRARDQASRATTAVADALKVLNRAQEDTSASADRTGSRLERFGMAMGDLQRQIQSSSVGERLNTDLDAAGRAVQRLERSLEQSQSDFSRYGAEALQASEAIERQRLASAALETQLARERVALSELRRERRAASTAVTRAGDDARPNTVAALERAEAAVESQQRAVAEINAEYRRSNAALRELGAQYNAVNQAVEKTGAAIQSQTRDLQRSRVGFLRLARDAGRASEAVAELGQSATRELRLAVGAQARVVHEAQSNLRAAQPGVGQAARDFRASQAAAEAYAQELGETATETRRARAEAEKLEQAFMTQRQIASALKSEYREQQIALGRLRNISRETATDTAELGARQTRFVAELQRAQNASQRTSSSIAQMQTRLGQLAAESQRASAQTGRHSAAQTRLATSIERANVAGSRHVGVLRNIFGEGRRALSVTQRLRGQVLAITTQYVGFFAVAQGFESVIQNVQKLEGVTNGLAAVFQGDVAVVNDQLDFLRRNSNRLGIAFTDLASQYTRFAAATRNTPIEDSTEAIFLRVAEAGRVLNLSADELNGTLTALSQIASIGTIQSEELRQQLGDRLPGAVQLLADGLNTSTENLFKLIDGGKVSSQALNNFADQLEKRFGAGLEGSLVSLNAELARLGNTAQQAQLRFAGAGFAEALTEAARDVREVLDSADFEDLIVNAAQVASAALRVLVEVIENFRLVVVVATTALALSFRPAVVAAAAAVTRFIGILTVGRAVQTFAIAMNSSSASIQAVAASSTVATGAVARLTAAMRFLVSSTGIGLLFVGAATGAALLATRTRDATEVLSQNRREVDKLRDAYDAAAGNSEAFLMSLEAIGKAGVSRELEQIQQTVKDIAAELTSDLLTGDGFLPELVSFDADLTRANGQVVALISSLQAGRITVTQFNTETDQLVKNFQGSERASTAFAQRVGDLQKNILLGQDGAAGLSDALTALIQIQARYALANGATVESLTEVQREALALGKVTAELGEAFVVGQRRAQGLQLALEEISKGVPKLAEEIKRTEELQTLSEILAAEGLPPTLEAIQLRLAAINAELAQTDDSSLLESLAGEASMLDQVLKVVQARVDEINRDKTPGGRRRGQSDPFQSALDRLNSSLAGDQLNLETDQLRAQNMELEAVFKERQAIVDGIDVSKFSETQKMQLAELGRAYVEFGRQIVNEDNLQRAAEGLRELQDAVAAMQQQQFELSLPDDASGRTAGFASELQRGLAELRQNAEASGVNANEIEKLASQYERAARAVFEIQEAQIQTNERIAEAARAEEMLNLLLDTRRSLIQQLSDARLAGDGSAIALIQARITALDGQIISAKDDALKLYATIAGRGDISLEEAENAAARIEAAIGAVSTAATRGGVTVGDLASVVSNNLSNAFGQFAESIANGENVLKSLGQAFRAFASETLIEIGRVIARALIMQAIFGALGFLGINPGGSIVGGVPISASINHSGREGNTPSTRNRTVSSAAFVGAPRFHEGRVGLSSGEMAAVIRRDEDVLTRDNPFSSANLGKTVRDLTNSGGGKGMSIKIVNVSDPAEALEMALSDNPGERVIMNFIRRNSEDINAALE